MQQAVQASAALCACGSGLRGVACCQQPRLLRTPEEVEKVWAPQVTTAEAALKKGELTPAAHYALQVLEQAPTLVAALLVLYQVRARENQAKAAEALLRRAVALNPNHLWATKELALLLYRAGRRGEAELNARNAIRLGPRDGTAHSIMGMVLTDANRNRAGEHHYRRALEILGESDRLLANLGLNLRNQGRLEESEACYARALALKEDNVSTLLGWIKLEESRRNFDKAWELLERAERLAPEQPAVVLQRATLHGRQKQHAKALEVLERFQSSQAEPGQMANLVLEKGHLLDRLERYDEAFACYADAKRLLRETSGNSYQDKVAGPLAKRLMSFFTKRRMELMPRASTRRDVAQPIFVCGFPRSGTTMTEQILTGHPLVAAGDELPFVGDLTRFSPRMLASPLGYPESLADLWMGDNQGGLDLMRDYYLQKVAQLELPLEGKAWFTDKMPLNEWHLGFITLLFPDSPIIHLHRHPLDVVLSCFSNFLTHGFYCAYALETAALHVARTFQLVEHYCDQLQLRYLPVRYEDLVADQEGGVRRILDFVGLPFDERCLAFHENTRYARTASYAQVTEPLYSRSRFRYRKYRRQLEPAAKILDGTIRRLGYRID